MKRAQRLLAIASLFGFGFYIASLVNIPADAITTRKPKCDKACQKANDRYFETGEYIDYFVNDSDGGKDLVFTVYRNVQVGDFRCAVVKSDNYSISTVCPGAVSAQGYAPPEPEE